MAEGTSAEARSPDVAPVEGLKLDESRFEDMVATRHLRRIWGEVRKAVRNLAIRDSVDWVDWAVGIEANLDELHESLIRGDYVPSEPARYEYPKAKGAFRVITVPNICDVLVFRLIAEAALQQAEESRVEGAFFSRRQPKDRAGGAEQEEWAWTLSYGEGFASWKTYQEYRSLTLLNERHPVLVIGDISNYFESISHDLLMEYLAPLGLPRKAVGLLGRLLEALKPPTGHSPNPRIGIPIDEFECSRTLAHIYLFEFDHQICDRFGHDNYARWMDDINVGASSEGHGRHVVHEMARALSRQRLTLNAGKTQFVQLEGQDQFFLLEANAALSDWQTRYFKKKGADQAAGRGELAELWLRFGGTPLEKSPNCHKVLKRFYRLGAAVGATFLETRALNDLIQQPEMAPYIFNYFASRNASAELVCLFAEYVQLGENLFEAVEAWFWEACLTLDARPEDETLLLDQARRFVTGSMAGQTGKPIGGVGALLALYWFGLSAGELLALFPPDKARKVPAPVARAWLAVAAALDPRGLTVVQKALVGHSSDDVAKLSRFLDGLLSGDVTRLSYYKRQKQHWAAKDKIYDVRAWLQLELMSAAPPDVAGKTARADLKFFETRARTMQDKRVLARVRARIAKDRSGA